MKIILNFRNDNAPQLNSLTTMRWCILIYAFANYPQGLINPVVFMMHAG